MRGTVDIEAMLCDHAQVAGGKLFISGGNIDRVLLPAEAAAPFFTAFTIAGLVRVPWTATNVEHSLTFKVLNEDGQNPDLVGVPDLGPSGISGEMLFNVGRAPQVVSGDEQTVPFAFGLGPLPLASPRKIVVILALDGREVRRLPFSIQVGQGGQGGPGPGFPMSPTSFPSNPLN